MSFTKGILFIHGRGRNSSDWQGCIDMLGDKRAFHLAIDIVDYDIYHDDTLQDILGKMSEYNSIKKWIIVAHSIGVIYALSLVNTCALNNLSVNMDIVLVDPTPLDEIYKQKLLEENREKLYEFISTIQDLKPKTRIHIHINYDDDSDRKIKYYSNFTKVNIKSRLEIHVGKGHMLHLKETARICESIRDILSSRK